MEGESILTAKDVIDVAIPIIATIITWFLTRIKNPDYGKKDWRCKEKSSPFISYTVFLVVMFLLPILTYIISFLLQKIYIEPIVGLFVSPSEIPNVAIRAYMVVITIVIYYVTYRFTMGIKVFFVPKKIGKGTNFVLMALAYLPIALNFVISLLISAYMDLSYYSRGTNIWIVVFQIIGMIILDAKKSYSNKKMTIVMKDGDSISADVESVYKKGKWLRITESKIPHKEKLVVFDDIKSIEYHH